MSPDGVRKPSQKRRPVVGQFAEKVLVRVAPILLFRRAASATSILRSTGVAARSLDRVALFGRQIGSVTVSAHESRHNEIRLQQEVVLCLESTEDAGIYGVPFSVTVR